MKVFMNNSMPSEPEDDQKWASTTKQLQHMMTGQSELLTLLIIRCC